MNEALMALAWVPWILALALAAAALVNLVAPEPVVQEFARLGYPAWLRPLVGVLELASAAMLLVPAYRMAGAWLAIALLLGVLVSVARQRDGLRLHYPLVLMALGLALVVPAL